MLIFATAKVDSIITKAISNTLFSMEYKGKQTCRILKDIRRQIAEANDIDLVISECTHRGDCLGTCPRCEAEVAYLERELARRQAMGKAVCISGIAASALLGMPAAAQMAASALPAANDTAVAIPEEELEGEIFVVVEEKPEFPGGQEAFLQFLKENVHYPEDAVKEGKEGRAICQFVVWRDGTIRYIEVVRSAGDERFDQEALRVLKSMPVWKPGKQRGRYVSVKYVLPFNFHFPAEVDKTSETIHVKGQVFFDDGDPSVGASIRIAGTLMTISDYDGLFELDAKPTDTLEISSIGSDTVLAIPAEELSVRLKLTKELAKEVKVDCWVPEEKKTTLQRSLECKEPVVKTLSLSEKRARLPRKIKKKHNKK